MVNNICDASQVLGGCRRTYAAEGLEHIMPGIVATAGGCQWRQLGVLGSGHQGVLRLPVVWVLWVKA